MKSDRYIQRDVQYHVRMANDGTLEQKTSLTGTYYITLSHLGVHNVPLSHEYKGYLRLYLPPHTQLKQEQKDYLIFSELGYTVVGIPLTLGVAETKHIQIDVILPEQLAQGGHYSVRPFLQPGLQNSHLSFSFTSPVDRFLSSKDKTVLVHENVATKSITYGQEQEVTIHISRDTTPPRVTLQSFLDYNKISVQFNEPLFESDCEDPSNYELIDTDIHVPDITNRPKIRMIKCSPTEAIVYTTNIRTQYGEAFRMNIRSLRDLNNNVISPNPMTVTIIQRFEKDKPSSDTQ
jgi:hypothetical protein